MITPSEIQALLTQTFGNAHIVVQDLTGTLDHYKVIVVSDMFVGKTLVQRHQLVNRTLAEPLKGPLHALTIEALTVDEAQKRKPAGDAPRGIQF